jgi:uncharacterized protein YegL
MTSHTLPTGSYGFSGTRLDQLGAAEYTLVTIVTDVSGSVSSYRSEMEQAIQQIVNACRLSPRADNLMIRLVLFNDRLEEAHGFKLLERCNLKDYQGRLRTSGSTALYDAAENSVAATTAYGRQLTDADFSVNGIVFVITDGMDNASTHGVGQLRDRLLEAVTTEALESLVSVLIGVGVHGGCVGGYLQDLKASAGFTQYIELEKADAKTLGRLAQFVSRSISAQSQALGSGAAAPSLTF